jgi:hypothetical protein
MRRYNSILWKVKEEIEMMTENYADILRVFRSYRLSSASNDFIVLKRINDTFEKNVEKLIQEGRSQ